MLVAAFTAARAQSYKFDFTGAKSPKAGFTAVSPSTVFTESQGYGYDFGYAPNGNNPTFFSVNVPDGNYKVTITFGSDKDAGSTTVRGEARRMYAMNVETKKGEEKTETFTVNKRNADINGKDKVKIKDREKTSMRWDEKLTLEFNGKAPRVKYVEIEPASDDVITVFLCGDSTVTDNDAEPYTGWGQMLPLFFNENVAVANYAESGLSANSFLNQKRLEKAMTQMKKGDYVLIEFGHNDQKQKGAGVGAYYSFAHSIKEYIDYAKQKGAKPILVTPTRRRQYDKDGKIKDTHEDYPAAMREIAAREGVVIIDFQDLTKDLIEAYSEEDSKALFVHHPMGTFPDQEKELKDNTHFSNFGAYEISKVFCQALADQNHPLAKYVRQGVLPFDRKNPDKVKDFDYQMSPLIYTSKPAGN